LLLKGKVIGLALTGSHCTLEETLGHAERFVGEGAELMPILSPSITACETRFGGPIRWRERVTALTGREPICTIAEAEPIGPGALLDALLIAPCTGNTMAKLACGITDSPVLMAAKAQLRNRRPVVLAISTNDGLGLNAKNLGTLLAADCVYFVPFGQDDPMGKPTSLAARMDLAVPAVVSALEGKQLQPVLVERWRD